MVESITAPCVKSVVREEIARASLRVVSSPMAIAWKIRRDAAKRFKCSPLDIHWGECMKQAWQEYRVMAQDTVKITVLPAQDTPNRLGIKVRGKLRARNPHQSHDPWAGTERAIAPRIASARWREVGKQEKRVVMMQNTAHVPWYEGEPHSTRGIGTDTAEFITSLERKTAWGKAFTAEGGSGGSYKPIVEMPTSSIRERRAINNLNRI